MKKLLYIFILLLCPWQIQAEEIYILDPVIVTAERIDEPVEIETTAFSETIHTAELDERYTTTEEVLRTASGSNVRSIGGLGARSTISLRGSSASQTLILIDGMRLNSGSGVDLSKLPLNNVERIEIIRGSNAALFGDNAMGGIVNIITKDPSDEFSGNVGSSIGSYKTYELQAGLNIPCADNIGLGLNIARRHSDNDFKYTTNNGTENDPRDDYETERANNQFDDLSIMSNFKAVGDSWKIKLLGSWYVADKEIPGTITFPTPYATQYNRRATLNLGSELFLTDYMDLNFNLGRVMQDDVYKDPESRLAPYSSNMTANDQFMLNTNFYAGLFTITPGFSYLKESMDDLNIDKKYRHTRSALMRVKVGNDIAESLTTVRFDNNSSYGNQWTYRTGATWFINDHLFLKGNTGTGYRIPSFYELYFSQGFIVSNPNLKPEESVSYDIGPGFKTRLVGGSINYFVQHYRNGIVYIMQSGFYYKPYNISRSKAQGFEAHLWTEPIEGLRISGNYTYNKAIDTTGEFNRDGNQLPGIPRNVYNVQLDYATKLKSVALSTYASFNYTEGNFVTRANTKKLDDREILNLGFTIKPIEELSITWDVKNALDQEATDLRGFPLEGRSYYLTLRGEF